MVDGLVILKFSWPKSRKIVDVMTKTAVILKTLRDVSS